MKVTKILASVVATGIAFVALTATTESKAGDEELVTVTCSNNTLNVTPKAPWHINVAAPWKWTQGEFDKASSSEQAAKFKNGKACGGEVKAFVCNGDQCKGPIKVSVPK